MNIFQFQFDFFLNLKIIYYLQKKKLKTVVSCAKKLVNNTFIGKYKNKCHAIWKVITTDPGEDKKKQKIQLEIWL